MSRIISIFRSFSLLSIGFIVSMSADAITIGDFKPLGSDRGVILITQLDGAEYLDVAVEVSGVPTNYVLEQVSADVVLIRLSDKNLTSESALISVKVDSPAGSTSRLFSHASSTSINDEFVLNTPEEVKQIEKVKEQSQAQSSGQVFIPGPDPNESIDNSEDENIQFEDGRLLIDITGKSVTTIGKAAFELARAKNFNLLILPGDDILLNEPLIESVSSFEDLYSASGKKVKHVYIDEKRRLVRIVDDLVTNQESALQFISKTPDEENDQSENLNSTEDKSKKLVVVTRLLENYAAKNKLKLLSLPGDNLLLSQSVPETDIDDEYGLAELANSINGIVDIDNSLGLIRLRRKSVEE